MKPFRIPAKRIVCRLARKLFKPIALWWNQVQLASSEAREKDMLIARGITVPLERYERQLQVELIARRNQIREW